MAAKTASPQFAPVAPPPPKVKAPTLTQDQAEALVQALTDSEWVTDGAVYTEPREAHNATNGYRRALASYGLLPDGQTLRGRVREQDGSHYLYLRFGPQRGTEVAAQDGEAS